MSAWPYPAPADDGGAAHLTAGTRLPDVPLPATSGGTMSLARLAGTAVAYIYTWTGRPGLANPPKWDDIAGAHGSTPQAEGFRDLHAAFAARGCAVLGISVQDTAHQEELVARLKLPFPILSDARHELREALRLPVFATGGVEYLKRLTLIVRDGRIAHAFYPVHPPDTHAREVLAWLERGG